PPTNRDRRCLPVRERHAARDRVEHRHEEGPVVEMFAGHCQYHDPFVARKREYDLRLPDHTSTTVGTVAGFVSQSNAHLFTDHQGLTGRKLVQDHLTRFTGTAETTGDIAKRVLTVQLLRFDEHA